MPTTRHTRSAALGIACLAACACQQQQGQADEAANAANAAQQKVVPEIPLPVPQKPLGREQLLQAAMQAATAYATSVNDADAQAKLADKDFEFRFRFGCNGQDGEGTKAFRWSIDPASGALKVHAAPTLSPSDPTVKAIAGEAFETVEGFWVRQPWLLSAACPRPNASAPPAAGEDGKPAPQPKQPPMAVPAAGADLSEAVGIAQFFTANGPRTLRRSGRPYEATKKLEKGDTPVGGFDLVLSGRLVALPDGRVIACTTAAQGQRPSCVISVEFGKVWIERADTHEHLAEWGSG